MGERAFFNAPGAHMVPRTLRALALLAAACAAALCLTLALAGTAHAVQTELDVAKGSIHITANSASVDDGSGPQEIAHNPEGYTIIGTTTKNTVTIVGGGPEETPVLITLDFASISSNASPLSIVSGRVELALADNNTLKCAGSGAGLHVPDGASLSIVGAGSLEATGGYGAAGIGGGYGTPGTPGDYDVPGGNGGNGGTVTIGGSALVTATGGGYGAPGIGGGSGGYGGPGDPGGDGGPGGPGGKGGDGGTVSIGESALVTATGGYGAAGLGGGSGGSGGDGGVIGGALGIGGAGISADSSIDGDVVVIAGSISAEAGFSPKRGVVFDGGVGTVYSSAVTLSWDVEVSTGETLTIGPGSALQIASGKALTVNGMLVNEGIILNNSTLTNSGTLTNDGAIYNAGSLEVTGSLSGPGAVYHLLTLPDGVDASSDADHVTTYPADNPKTWVKGNVEDVSVSLVGSTNPDAHPASVTLTGAALRSYNADEGILAFAGVISAPVTISVDPLSFADSPDFDVPEGKAGTAISDIVVAPGASGGVPPYAFSKTKGPDWLEVSDKGVITGTRPSGAQPAAAATIQVADGAGATASIEIAVGAVIAAVLPTPAPDFTGIVPPTALGDIAAGTPLDQIKLPKAVTIHTTQGDRQAHVSWDLASATPPYDPNATEEQTFALSGTITLPGSVTNTGRLPLITSITITINAAPQPPDPVLYRIVEGAKAQWTKGSQESLRFTSDGAFSKLTGVLLDGQPLDSVHYTAQSGSTIVELKASYLETLAEGSHTLRTTFSDGYAETTFTIKASSVDEQPTDPGGPPQPLYPDGSKPSGQPGSGEPKPLVRTGDSTLPSALEFAAAAATGTLALALARKRAQKRL